MNKYFTGLIIKFILTLIGAYIAYRLIDGNSFMWVLIVALTVTILSSLIGDYYLLPKYGNSVALLGDAIMAPLIAYLISLLSYYFDISWFGTIVFIILIVVFEYFLHRYLKRDRID